MLIPPLPVSTLDNGGHENQSDRVEPIDPCHNFAPITGLPSADGRGGSPRLFREMHFPLQPFFTLHKIPHSPPICSAAGSTNNLCTNFTVFFVCFFTSTLDLFTFLDRKSFTGQHYKLACSKN